MWLLISYIKGMSRHTKRQRINPSTTMATTAPGKANLLFLKYLLSMYAPTGSDKRTGVSKMTKNIPEFLNFMIILFRLVNLRLLLFFNDRFLRTFSKYFSEITWVKKGLTNLVEILTKVLM